MLISELMTTALTTGHANDLVEQTMCEMKRASIRHLPVVNGKNKLVGIVWDRDLLLSLGLSKDRNVYLRDIMTKTVETVSEDTDAAQAVAVMLDRKIGALPVVGERGQLVGVVTATDFLELAQYFLSGAVTSDGHASWRE